ncbi:MAG: multidrug effflux MFS transporter [Deltaproteobacteria bacterium]|nr:multidrug effflux MFS transporter [Deltaproteobacteria bacterium]
MPAPHPSAVGSRRWIGTLAAVTAIVALSIDMSLPAQPTLARAFDVRGETAQLTLTLFLIGFACAQLVAGYLSDAWGRRRVMCGGLILFVAGGVACAVAPTIEVLLARRVIQGIGAAGAPVVARAMVRDTQPSQQAARLLSTMLAAIAIAPMIAPLVGAGLLEVVGWRGIYAALAACGVVMLAVAYGTLPETLPVERRAASVSVRGIARSYVKFLATPGTVLPMLVSCAAFAGQFGYIADSPFVLVEGYGLSEQMFGVVFGATALALMLGSIAGGRMLRAGRQPATMLRIGTVLLLAGGATVVLGTRADIGLVGFVAPMLVYFFGIGLTSPSATALAMEPCPQLAGTASAAIGFCTMTAGAFAGYQTTKLGGSSPDAFAIGAGAMAVVAAALAWRASRRPVRRITGGA